MQHPNEEILERFLLDAESTSAKEQIQSHLETCRGCLALYRDMEEYHKELSLLRNARRGAQDLAGQIVPSLRGQPPIFKALRPGLPSRLIQYAFRHPVRTSASAIVAAVLVVVSLFQTSATSPSFAQAQNGFLVAYSSTGTELWRTWMGTRFTESVLSVTKLGSLKDENTFVSVGDLDDDGRAEVLAAYGVVGGSSSDVVCFNADGSERWRSSLGRAVTFGGTEYTDDFLSIYVQAGDFDSDGRTEIIAYARHRTYFPGVVARLNVDDGRVESEYWHCGWFSSVVSHDLNGDGIQELLFGGQNNSFDLASLVVLDSRSIEGSSPARESHSFDGMSPGSEEAYVLIPRSELTNLTSKPRNRVTLASVSKDSLIQLAVTESLFGGMENSEYLFLDFSLRCVRIGPSDDFAMAYDLAKRQGKALIPLEEIYARVRSGIRYWNGSTFTPSPWFRSAALPHFSSKNP